MFFSIYKLNYFGQILLLRKMVTPQSVFFRRRVVLSGSEFPIQINTQSAFESVQRAAHKSAMVFAGTILYILWLNDLPESSTIVENVHDTRFILLSAVS
jgi:hypothetical protein